MFPIIVRNHYNININNENNNNTVPVANVECSMFKSLINTLLAITFPLLMTRLETMANAVHVYDDDEDTISTIIINRDHGHYRSRQLLTAHQPPTGYLTDHQCANIASLLVNSTEQSMLFTKSCQTNFIYINRLYDQSTLIFVNFPEWSFDNGKRMVIQTSFVRLLFQSMINLVGIRLVVRVEQCNKLVDVSLSPPPPQKSGGLIQMEVNEMENLNIREHLLHEYILSDICEIRLIDNNNNCSLTNSYLVACTKNDDTICQVRVYDWKQKLLECECGTSSKYFNHCFCAFIFICLILISKLNILHYDV